ncbi:N-acetyl sugar amidotransferase [Gammaproteobacteria bacterium]|nr:N-acetyl sugar amidotransferase [Gammaproteobacteria bacterium]
MKFCKTCLYPENHPLGIIFDSSGQCSGCKVHVEKDQLDWPHRFEKLKKITSSYKSSSRTIHDCIVPISGARDSHFILHIVKNILGMKPLLVNYNIHYNTKMGIRNLAYLRSLVGADFMQMTVQPDKVKKITLETIKTLGSIYWHILAGQTVFPVQIACKYKIPLIIWGAHQGIDQVGMFSHLDEVEMTRKYRKDHDLMGIEAEDFVNAENNLDESDLYQYFYPNDAELAAVGVRGIYLNNFIRWDSRKQHEEMISMYDYHTNFQQRTFDNYNDVDSHHYSGIHDYIKLIKHGYGKVTDHASREIRLNSMTRGKGLSLVKKHQDIYPSDAKLFCKWIDLPEEDFWNEIEKHRNQDLWTRTDEGEYTLKFSPFDTSQEKGLRNEPLDKNEQWEPFVINNSLKDTNHSEYILMGRGWTDKNR